MPVFAFWFPLPLVWCVLPAWIKYLWSVGALCCGVPWHPAEIGTEVSCTAGTVDFTLLKSEPFPQRVFLWTLGALGIRNMNIISFSKTVVICEGGHTMAVSLNCESPFWVPPQGPGLRQGGCSRLLGGSSVELKGKSFLFQLPQQSLTDGEVKKAAPLSHVKNLQSSGECQEAALGEHKGQRILLIPLSSRCLQQELKGFFSPPLLSIIPSLPPYVEVRAAGAAGSIFLPKASRTGPEPCKLARCWHITEYLAQGKFCSLFPFSQTRFLS